jgi:hypothetical protein
MMYICILYFIHKQLHPLKFDALRLKLSSGYVKKRRYVQLTTFVICFWKNIYHIYVTAEVAAIDFTYVQYNNIHMTFVAGNNARIVVMARPKLSQCM